MTAPRNHTAPFLILFLVLPYGISSGFASVTLPFLLVKNGFTVAAAAAITAWGLSANLWRFIWAPLTDLTLTLHKWYWLGVIGCSASLSTLCLIPLDPKESLFLTIVVFLSQIAATFVVAPVGGIIARTVVESKKGRAGGWYQAGNLGGMGLGGGAGIWLAEHYSYLTAGASLSLLMLCCIAALIFIPQVVSEKDKTFATKFKSLLVEIGQLFRSPIAVFTIIVILTPIGIGAISYIFSSLGKDWKVDADTIALVTGTLSGIATGIGCVIGGWVADKYGRWWSFFGSGTVMALVTLAMYYLPFTPNTYIVGVLVYALTFGSATGAFSAVVLLAMGEGSGSTKYALISSISNLAPVYMTALDGWLHDKYSVKTMLLGETLLGLGFVFVSLFALQQLRARKILQ